jgi:hypothetical protein
MEGIMDKFDKNKQGEQQAPSQGQTDKSKYGTREDESKQGHAGKPDQNQTDRTKVGAPGQGQR